VLVSTAVYAVHCTSVHYTDFEYIKSDEKRELDSNLLDLSQCSKILFVTGAVVNYIFKEFCNAKLNDSCLLIRNIEKFVENKKNLSEVVKFLNYFMSRPEKEPKKNLVWFVSFSQKLKKIMTIAKKLSPTEKAINKYITNNCTSRQPFESQWKLQIEKVDQKI
jgi:hypothetical protein